jgi:hypothetical protein
MACCFNDSSIRGVCHPPVLFQPLPADAGHEKLIDPANEWHEGLSYVRQQATIVAIDPDILSGRGPAAA